MLSQPNPDTGLTSLQEAMLPWLSSDLAIYLQAIGLMFAQVESYAADQADGTPGWSIMLDIDNCPTEALPYLGQWVGARLPPGMTDAQSREWIRTNAREERGTPTAILNAASRWLTGTQIVQIAERQDGTGAANNDWITIQVFTSQCPNLGAVLAELRKTIPADVQFAFNQITEETWLSVKNTYATWAAVTATGDTWATLQGAQTGYITWTPTP
jgi:hypothetical protein